MRLRFSARASLHAAKSTRKLKERCSYAHAHAPHSVPLAQLAQYDANTMARWRTTVSIDAKAARGIAAHVATLQTDRGPAGAHAACALVHGAVSTPRHGSTPAARRPSRRELFFTNVTARCGDGCLDKLVVSVRRRQSRMAPILDGALALPGQVPTRRGGDGREVRVRLLRGRR